MDDRGFGACERLRTPALCEPVAKSHFRFDECRAKLRRSYASGDGWRPARQKIVRGPRNRLVRIICRMKAGRRRQTSRSGNGWLTDDTGASNKSAGVAVSGLLDGTAVVCVAGVSGTQDRKCAIRKSIFSEFSERRMLVARLMSYTQSHHCQRVKRRNNDSRVPYPQRRKHKICPT